MHFLGLFRCCRNPSTDGPNRFIGNNDGRHGRCGQMKQAVHQLSENESCGLTGFTNGKRLSAAEDRGHPGSKNRIHLIPDDFIRLAKSLPALRVSCDDMTNAEVSQHRQTDLPGKGTGWGGMAILSCDLQRSTIGLLAEHLQMRKGRRHDHLTGERMRQPHQDGPEQLPAGLQTRIHLPVRGNHRGSDRHLLSIWCTKIRRMPFLIFTRAAI